MLLFPKAMLKQIPFCGDDHFSSLPDKDNLVWLVS